MRSRPGRRRAGSGRRRREPRLLRETRGYEDKKIYEDEASDSVRSEQSACSLALPSPAAPDASSGSASEHAERGGAQWGADRNACGGAPQSDRAAAAMEVAIELEASARAEGGVQDNVLSAGLRDDGGCAAPSECAAAAIGVLPATSASASAASPKGQRSAQQLQLELDREVELAARRRLDQRRAKKVHARMCVSAASIRVEQFETLWNGAGAHGCKRIAKISAELVQVASQPQSEGAEAPPPRPQT